MQATTQAPTAPAAPAPAETPQALTTTADGKTIPLAIPQSQTDIEALYARRQDIRDQLSSLSQRRHSLVQEIRSAPDGVSRTGLEQRVTLLDQNIMQYEKELTSISQRLDAAPSELLHSYQGSPDAMRQYDSGFEDGVGSGIGGTLFAVVVLYFIMRWRGKRKNKKAGLAESTESPRLARLEQGMDAIAIEIERISEGQRFVTKLMSESREPISARIAQPAQQAER
jgi:hypothetical protein